MKKIFYPVILGLIVALAFFLRIYKVTSIPPSLNWDEVSIGYNAYSILKTSKDEWGVKFPLNFKSYGEYKLPAQIYASIPGIAVFGLNEFGVRITPVIYGVFFWSRKLLEKGRCPLCRPFCLRFHPGIFS
ncbi:MAG: hypothetical protein UT88_C0033G0011 [Candidatus Woesebacteria bacterium GW2011_GWD2_40_19]|nr:MAG: hypothetical protein UT88_C0033G0011 [Candidatus Woesebacteria bacterium GW2011_GWD2_40_19]